MIKLTKRYTKMCEKARELQDEWIIQVGDYVAERDYHDEVIMGIVIDITEDNLVKILYSKNFAPAITDEIAIVRIAGTVDWVKKHKVWLPVQEQIQEMVKEIIKCSDTEPVTLALIREFEYHPIISMWGYKIKYESDNELWLAWLMDLKYHKAWDDEKEDWIKLEGFDERMEDSN